MKSFMELMHEKCKWAFECVRLVFYGIGIREYIYRRLDCFKYGCGERYIARYIILEGLPIWYKTPILAHVLDILSDPDIWYENYLSDTISLSDI